MKHPDRTKIVIDADLRPPFTTEIVRGAINIINDNHVIATMSVSRKHAFTLAHFIASACNKCAAEMINQ